MAGDPGQDEDRPTAGELGMRRIEPRSSEITPEEQEAFKKFMEGEIFPRLHDPRNIDRVDAHILDPSRLLYVSHADILWRGKNLGEQVRREYYRRPTNGFYSRAYADMAAFDTKSGPTQHYELGVVSKFGEDPEKDEIALFPGSYVYFPILESRAFFIYAGKHLIGVGSNSGGWSDSNFSELTGSNQWMVRLADLLGKPQVVAVDLEGGSIDVSWDSGGEMKVVAKDKSGKPIQIYKIPTEVNYKEIQDRIFGSRPEMLEDPCNATPDDDDSTWRNADLLVAWGIKKETP